MYSQQFKLLASMLMSALVVIGLAIWFVFPSSGRLAAPPLFLIGFQVLAGVLVGIVCESFGYRQPPIPPGTPRKEAAGSALARWQSGMMLRFALSEAIAITSLAVAFAIHQGGFVVYLVGAVISEVLIFVHVFPWERPIEKTAQALESTGGRSYLRELFGLEPWTGTEEDKPASAGNQRSR